MPGESTVVEALSKKDDIGDCIVDGQNDLRAQGLVYEIEKWASWVAIVPLSAARLVGPRPKC